MRPPLAMSARSFCPSSCPSNAPFSPPSLCVSRAIPARCCRRARRVAVASPVPAWALSLCWRACPVASRRRVWRACGPVCGALSAGAAFRRLCRQRWLPGCGASSPPRSWRAASRLRARFARPQARRVGSRFDALARRGCSAGEIATAPARRRVYPANSPARLSVATRPAPLTRRARPPWLHRRQQPRRRSSSLSSSNRYSKSP